MSHLSLTDRGWIKRDAAGAQRAVCAAMPGSRAGTRLPAAAAAPVYPLAWASSVRAANGRPIGARGQATQERGYPANWLPRASARSGKSRITEAND